jgi:probable HAF family extracellular repeat protein
MTTRIVGVAEAFGLGREKMNSWRSLICIVLSAVAAGAVQAGPRAYVLTHFKGLANTPFPNVNDLNNLGAASGALAEQPTQGAYWSSPTSPRLLSSLGDTNAWGLDNQGNACGAARPRALYWDATGVRHALPDLDSRLDLAESRCNRINDAGVKIGTSQTPDGHTHAVTWDSSNAIHDLGTLQGSSGDSEALAISPSGSIVGKSSVASTGEDSSRHAVLWQGGALTDLGTLGGRLNSVANSVNDAGEIVGQSDINIGTNDTAPLTRPVLWRSGAPVDLGIPSPYTRGAAYSINASGSIVGNAYNDPQEFLWDSHAILWDHGHGTHHLTASFAGSGAFASSTSPVLDEVIRFRMIPLPPPHR